MKLRVALSTLSIVLFCSLTSFAQGRGAGRSRTLPRNDVSPDLNSARLFFSGRAVLQDGSAPPGQAAVQTVCKGRKHTEGYTDSHGNFSFQFGTQTSNPAADGHYQDAETSAFDMGSRRGRVGDWNDCEVQVSLDGYASGSIPLASRLASNEGGDLGVIQLRPLTRAEGLTISATTAMAPADAKKAYEKGRDHEQHQQWQKAQAEFEKAVAKFPRFAAAWFELGVVFMRSNDFAGAHRSWEQSVQADDKFISPYLGLAALALREAHWDELARFTDHILSLDPTSYPMVWFHHAAANFYLHNLDAAEKSALQGLRVDEHHQAGKLEFLLGLILAEKHEYQAASDHIKNYLQRATQPADIDAAKKKLDEIARLSAVVVSPSAPAK